MFFLPISQGFYSNMSMNLMLFLSSSSGGSQFGLTSQHQEMHWWIWDIEMSVQLPPQGKKVFYTFYSVMSIVDKYVYDIRFIIYFLLVMLIIAV
jgi:hypothetical protein